ncbi:MAG: hypothetical protein ACJASM_003162 [Salibacteraceae bacterium]
MNKLKISAYGLIAVSILKIGMLYPLKELGEEINDMEIRYSDMRSESDRIGTFEDSLIYNSEFRTKILGEKITRATLDSAIANNRKEAEQAIEEIEILYDDRMELGSKFKIFSGIDQLLELLMALTGGLMIYYWIKLRN